MNHLDATALAFLADIAANPTDDAPRLIFADWLDDRGDPDSVLWADLIRVQVARASMVPFSPAFEGLRSREFELLQRARQRFVRPFPRIPQVFPQFKRGMLQLYAHTRYFLENEEKARGWLRDQGPSVTAVDLHFVPAARTSSLTRRWEEELPAIELIFNQGAARDTGIAHVARLRKLVSLVAHDTHVTDKGLAHLSGHGRLQNLLLGVPKVTDEGVEHVASIQGLHGLVLSNSAVTDAALPLLAPLRELRILGLAGTAVTSGGMGTVAGLPRLRRLILSRTALDDSGLQLLSRSPSLEDLILDATRVTDAGLTHLRTVHHLRMLSVRETAVTKAGVAALRGALPHLHVYE